MPMEKSPHGAPHATRVTYMWSLHGTKAANFLARAESDAGSLASSVSVSPKPVVADMPIITQSSIEGQNRTSIGPTS